MNLEDFNGGSIVSIKVCDCGDWYRHAEISVKVLRMVALLHSTVAIESCVQPLRNTQTYLCKLRKKLEIRPEVKTASLFLLSTIAALSPLLSA